MKLGVVTLFLPRLELDHLREWIHYHRSIGISRFFLYNNGPVSCDPIFGTGTPERVWAKKPEADYHLELSDEEVHERIHHLLSEFGDDVVHQQWYSGSDAGRSFRDCQRSAANHALCRQQQTREVDWLGHLDVDELLVCGAGNLTDVLAGVRSNVDALQLHQKLFESRWRNGRPQPYSTLTRSFGVVDFNRKFLVRVGAETRWRGPHRIRQPAGSVWSVPPHLLRFHHFRGIEHCGSDAPAGWGIRRLRDLSPNQTVTDDSHTQVASAENELSNSSPID